ncbi:hypothetical protein AAFN47_21650 [Hoeflea sp. CAU 1731]
MTAIKRSALLHRALYLDAAASGALALMLAFGAAPLSNLLGFDPFFLRFIGLLLLPYAILVGWTARPPVPDRQAARLIIGCNIAWVAASILFLFSGWTNPTTLGQAFVVAQAAAVGLFTELQIMGLKKTG